MSSISSSKHSFRENFDVMIEKIRSEIVSSFSELMQVLEKRRDLLLQQLDRFAKLENIFPSYSDSDRIASSLLSELGLNESTSPQPLYDVKFNLDPNISVCLRSIGLLQINLADALSLPVRKVITSDKSGHTPTKVCWNGEKLFVLDAAHKQVDVFNRSFSALTRFHLSVEITNDDLTCITASPDYLLLTRQSSNIVTYYQHDGTLLPGLPYELKRPVSITSSRGMVAIADELLHHVLLFEQYSDCVTLIGSQSDRPGQLYKPADVAFMSDKSLIVLDHQNPCFHIYDLKARLLTSFGCSLVRYDMSHPACFSLDGDLVLLVHMRSKKVTIYSPDRSMAFKVRVNLDEMTSAYLFPTGCSAQGDMLAVAYADNGFVGVCDISEFKKGFIFP